MIELIGVLGLSLVAVWLIIASAIVITSLLFTRDSGEYLDDNLD
jgi:hypothetical protein